MRGRSFAYGPGMSQYGWERIQNISYEYEPLKVFYLNVFLRMIIFKIPILRLIFLEEKKQNLEKISKSQKSQGFFLRGGFFLLEVFFFLNVVVSGLEENCC